MTERMQVKLGEQELLTFVTRCFQWSNADVFAMGRRDAISRLGEIAAYISNLSGKDERPAAQSVRIAPLKSVWRDLQQEMRPLLILARDHILRESRAFVGRSIQ